MIASRVNAEITAVAVISAIEKRNEMVDRRLNHASVFTKVRMHLVHNTLRTIRPSSITLIVWRFGRNVR